MKTIKLMPDYGCAPLWWAGDHAPGMIDYDELPLSRALRDALEAWAREFDSFLDMDDPGHSPEVPPEVARAFDEEGARLWRALRAELGAGWHVQYFEKGRVLDDPSQLGRP